MVQNLEKFRGTTMVSGPCYFHLSETISVAHTNSPPTWRGLFTVLSILSKLLALYINWFMKGVFSTYPLKLMNPKIDGGFYARVAMWGPYVTSKIWNQYKIEFEASSSKSKLLGYRLQSPSLTITPNMYSSIICLQTSPYCLVPCHTNPPMKK